jgi:5'-nucleotidase / UDP-sugar diphosphatase
VNLPTKRSALVAIGFTSLLSLAACGGNSSTPTAYELQILHFADADGSDTVALDSVANLSGLVAKFRAERPNNTLVVSSGDNYIPGPRFNAADSRSPVDMRAILGREAVGRADIAFLNSIGVQASAVGNHELDLGTATFASAINSGSGWPGASFPFLAYNVDFSTDEETRELVGNNGDEAGALAGKLAGWSKIQIGGQTIGVIGASSATFPQITTTGKLSFSPAPKGGIEDVDGLAAVLQQGVNQMLTQGIDKVVMLAHMQQISTEKALASKLRGVDVIVAGGSNTLLSDGDDKLRAGDKSAGEYPFVAYDRDGQPVLVVNVDSDYKYLGRLVVPFDAKGNVLVPNLNSRLNGPVATSMTDDGAGGVTPSAQVQSIRDALKTVINAKDGEFYGYSNVFLEGRRSFVRTQESNAGNIAADAQLWYAQQVDPTVQIALKNGGGIRAEIGKIDAPPGSTLVRLLPTEANSEAGRPAGTVSLLMLETSYKFNNSLWVFDISAERLVSVLNHGVSDVENIKGQFPQVAGLTFSFDPSLPAGSRVRSVKVGSDVVAQNGIVVGEPTRIFRIVTMSFLATGGDNYLFSPSGEKATEDTLPNLLKLDSAGVADAAGGRVSLTSGKEQDSLAEFLAAFHATPETAYSIADTPAELDERIQNLSVRSDTVLQ